MNQRTIIFSLFAFSVITNHAMQSKQEIFDAARVCNAQKLQKLITPENANLCDQKGISILVHATAGAYEYRRFSEFEKIVEILKNNKANFDQKLPDSRLSGIVFASNLACAHAELRPLQILCEAGGDPFFSSASEKLSAFHAMLNLSDEPERFPFAFKVAQEMGKFARNLHDAAKAVSPSAVRRMANVDTVKQKDGQNKTALFYTIRYGDKASDEDLSNVIKTLVQFGANANERIPDVPHADYSYMHLATTGALLTKSLKVLKALLAHGGSPRASGDLPEALCSPQQMVEVMKRQEPYGMVIGDLFRKHTEQSQE